MNTPAVASKLIIAQHDVDLHQYLFDLHYESAN